MLLLIGNHNSLRRSHFTFQYIHVTINLSPAELAGIGFMMFQYIHVTINLGNNQPNLCWRVCFNTSMLLLIVLLRLFKICMVLCFNTSMLLLIYIVFNNIWEEARFNTSMLLLILWWFLCRRGSRVSIHPCYY